MADDTNTDQATTQNFEVEVPAAATESTDAITWTASEFVAHDKTAGWYITLILVAGVVTAIIYLITKDYISAAVVVVAAMLLGVYGSHKPRQLEYKLDRQTMSIGPKNFHYDQFKSFSVLPEGAFSSIVFMPLKRFSPPISIYYAPEDEKRIIEMLSSRLPFEERRRDAVETLMHKIRF